MTDRPLHPADCHICHGAEWYKEEAAPVTRECDCQDHIADTGKNGQEALKEFDEMTESICNVVQINGAVDLKHMRVSVRKTCCAIMKLAEDIITARQEPINQELLEALKGIKKFAISKMEDPSRAKEMKIFTDAEEAIARAEAQKGE